jgi:phosphoribosylanthranilate isomerase
MSAHVLVKICGITRVEDAIAASELGADFLGMIFVPSSARCISSSTACRIREALERRSSRAKLVGVFRNAPLESMSEIASQVPLDFVQLHGEEDPSLNHEIAVPVIKAFRVADSVPDTSAWRDAAFHLYDAFSPRADGGSGESFDWTLLESLRPSRPSFVAGGLDAGNVREALRVTRAAGVDVASGVESAPGVKSRERLERFFESVRSHS